MFLLPKKNEVAKSHKNRLTASFSNHLKSKHDLFEYCRLDFIAKENEEANCKIKIPRKNTAYSLNNSLDNI